MPFAIWQCIQCNKEVFLFTTTLDLALPGVGES